VDLDDVPSDIAARKLVTMKPRSAQAWYWRRLTRQLRSVEKALLATCDHAWVAKLADLHFVNSAPASVLPNIPYSSVDAIDVESCPPPEKSRVVLIVGTMSWGPNEKAVDRFLAESWPAVREAEPDATFRIVGVGMSAAMRSRWGGQEGVVPVGFVDDLRSEYQRAAFAVCPLWEGGGSNIKVLEALRHGRTIVCTPCGARGYEGRLLDGESILVRDDMRAFADACIALLRAPSTAADLAHRGQRVVSSEFTYDVFRKRVHAAVHGVIEARNHT
jgi:glycosyltransferase involved in cell wall biosynthesis